MHFIKKENLTQALSCEFYEISKNTFFTEHLRKISSVTLNMTSNNIYFPFKFHVCASEQKELLLLTISVTRKYGCLRLSWWEVLFFFFFSIWVFFHEHLRFTGQQGKGKAISSRPPYYFHPLHRHLDTSLAITAESSPPHIASTAGLEPGTFGFREQVANH